jgi:hypothetical protein
MRKEMIRCAEVVAASSAETEPREEARGPKQRKSID